MTSVHRVFLGSKGAPDYYSALDDLHWLHSHGDLSHGRTERGSSVFIWRATIGFHSQTP